MSKQGRGFRIVAWLVGGWIALAPQASTAASASWLEDIIISSFRNASAPSAFDPKGHGLSLGQDASGRVYVEHRNPLGEVRRGWLGAVAPIGSASARAMVDGTSNTILAFHGDGDFVDLYALGALDSAGPLVPARLASVSVSRRFDPDTLRLGIIAILIGLAKAPQSVPVLSFTDADTHRVLVWDGISLLPFIEQQS